MKNLYFLAALATTPAAVAQPTIQAMHLPQAGQVWVIHEDTVGGSAYLPTPGGAAAQTWNYAALNSDDSFSLELLPPAGIPGADQFPTASYVIGEASMGEYWYTFFRNSAAGNENLGHSGGWDNGTSIGVAEGMIEIPVPFTYGTNVVQNSNETIIVTYSTGASMHRRYTSHTYTGDAHGTMITPAYPGGVEVVRMRLQQTFHLDSTFTDDEGTGTWTFVSAYSNTSFTPHYLFLQAAAPVYVAGVDENASYVGYFSNTVTDVKERTVAAPATAYPNPANGPITIVPGDSKAERLEVINAAGSVSRAFSIQGADRIMIETEGWVQGVYAYRCLDAAGILVGQGTFLVTR